MLKLLNRINEHIDKLTIYVDSHHAHEIRIFAEIVEKLVRREPSLRSRYINKLKHKFYEISVLCDTFDNVARANVPPDGEAEEVVRVLSKIAEEICGAKNVLERILRCNSALS